MNSTSTVRIKEKIRFDINFHREQNKRILLNSRRGVIDEEEDQNNEFTVEDMKNVALKITRKNSNINLDSFKLLKHGLLNGQEFIVAFCRTQGAVDSLLHYASSTLLQLPIMRY